MVRFRLTTNSVKSTRELELRNNEMFDFIVKNQDEAVRPQKTRVRTCTVYMGEVPLPLSLSLPPPLSLSLPLSLSRPFSMAVQLLFVCVMNVYCTHSYTYLPQ